MSSHGDGSPVLSLLLFHQPPDSEPRQGGNYDKCVLNKLRLWAGLVGSGCDLPQTNAFSFHHQRTVAPVLMELPASLSWPLAENAVAH